ncbi:MAG: ParB/RepB/Spo0J family partition protein [Lachnospiraceae bacterium]|nr:ParB/RepB/Spo0J family partition protein [Lachnospiraceae bacterium]
MGKYQNVNLSNLGFMNDFSKSLAHNTFRIEKIQYDKIITNTKNKYSIEKIEELEFSILHNGLKQNLEVKDNGDGTYTLISGERRYTALSNLIAQGHNEFELIPCLITDTEQHAVFLDENGSEILTSDDKEDWAIVTTNSENREFTDSDRAFQVSTLKRIYTKLSDNGVKLPGRISQLIAEQLDISKATVERLSYIEQHGTEELKAKISQNKISIGAAADVAHLSPAQQNEILKKDNITSATVKTHQQNKEKKKAQRKDNTVLKNEETISLSQSEVLNNSLAEFEALYEEIFSYDLNTAQCSKTDINALKIKLNIANKNLTFINDFLRKLF